MREITNQYEVCCDVREARHGVSASRGRWGRPRQRTAGDGLLWV